MSDTLLLVAGGFVAALVSGASGFGFAVIASALWSPLVAPQQLTALVLVLQFALNLAYLPFLWRDISLVRLAPFALGSAVGVPAGAWLLGLLPVQPLRLVLGAVLLAWGLAMLRRGGWPKVVLSRGAERVADTAVGAAAGVLAGVVGLSGVLPALWCAAKGGDLRANRGVVQGFILFSSLLGMFWVGRVVGIDEPTRERLLLCLPVVLVGGLAGLRWFSRMTPDRFNRLLLTLVALCGALLVVQAGGALLR